MQSLISASAHDVLVWNEAVDKGQKLNIAQKTFDMFGSIADSIAGARLGMKLGVGLANSGMEAKLAWITGLLFPLLST